MISDLQKLVIEYQDLKAGSSSVNWEQIEAKLIDRHEWSPEAATSLIRLAREHGAFVLRNATALAIACDCEDGDLGM